jgi:hypothetical protein
MGALTVLGASSGFGAFSYMLTVDLGYLFYASVVLLAVAISCLTMHESQLPVSPENAKYVHIPWFMSFHWAARAGMCLYCIRAPTLPCSGHGPVCS